MFTGLIRYRGELLSRQGNDNGERIVFALHNEIPSLKEGDSIAVNGVCLTALDLSAQSIAADLSRETLALTTLGQLDPGAVVNLETSLRLGDSLDGHLVSGHVDGVGYVRKIELEELSARVWVNAPSKLMPLIAVKGSITLDGVSLTVNAVDQNGFCVQLIPHTRQLTTLGALQAGQAINLETDMLARYVTRYLSASAAGLDDKIKP